ncbi:MAG TPA: hypothetical protein VMD31_01035 [Opitutaceae bacterium]|nr:hypothetical protein [Opitutaceae bacterium]
MASSQQEFFASQRLHRFGVLALVAAEIWLYFRTPLKDPWLVGGGLLIVFLSAWPALEWARHHRQWFPAFEIFMLTLVNFYAMPLLAGNPPGFTFDDGVYWQAATAVLLFQLAAIVGFNLPRWQPRLRPWVSESLLPESMLRYTNLGLWLNTLYLYVANFTDLVPWELVGTIRAIFFGIGIMSVFIQSRLWGLGQLTLAEKVTVVVNLLMQMVLLFSSLYLIQGLSLFVLAVIGYTTACRRIPVVLAAAVLVVVAVLHNGKGHMREIYWDEGMKAPTLSDLPSFYSQWVSMGLTASKQQEVKNRSLAENLFERASLFQMLCLVVDRVPAYEPYLYGESYVDIPALLIPRPFWPEKPSTLLSNVRLALYFHLVDEDSALKVSIAFGPLAEAYANFGLIGMAVLGLCIGLSAKVISLVSVGAPQLSTVGLFVILLTAWAFQVEQVAATWITSLFQAAVVVVGVPLLYRFLFRRT